MARPRVQDAEERLLSAGLNLFARRGSERVNTNAIARRARVGIGTFYKHFADKHALLREIERRTLAALATARVEAIRALGPDASPFDQVEHSTRAAIRFAESHPEAYRVTFGRERAGAAHHGPVVSESSRPVASALAALQAAGAIDRGLDVELAARAYQAMEVGTILWWLDDPGRASPDALVATLARLHPVHARAADVDEGAARSDRAASLSTRSQGANPDTRWRRVPRADRP